MKKQIATIILAAGCVFAGRAEGYQVNTLSAKQNGMGHTGTALKLGAESQIFNPAGMGWMQNKVEVEASVSPIFSTVKATVPDGKTYETDNNASTPMSVNAAFSIYDNLKAGISFYTPYGSSINWTDNWPGAVLNQSVDLKMFTIQPTFAWQITPKLSIGAGLMITWGTVDLNKGLVSAATFDQTLGPLVGLPALGNTTPASVNLTGNAHPNLGINAGVMYDINDRWTVGINYRSQMTMKVKTGDVKLRYASEAVEQVLQSQIGVLNGGQFTAKMPCAAIYSAGVSYKPVKGLVVAFDAQFTQWDAYKSLDIEFLNDNLTQFNQYIDKNYKNSWTFHLGAQYALTERFDVRAGLMVDTTPVSSDCYNPETPGMTKIEPSIGLSFRPVKHVSIDLGLLYVAGLGADNRSVSYDDLILKSLGMPENVYKKTFVADYSVHAFCPSIGLSFAF